MTPPVPDLFGRATAVTADHAHLRTVWKSLREIVRSGGLAFHPRTDASKFIDEFASELREHFAAEEAEGYFGALVAERPELHSLVGRLRQEHREMLELVALLLAPIESGEAAGDLDSVMRDLLDRFHHHERAEAQMLQEFFGRDEGGEGS
jgi:hemerythrin